MVQLPQVQAQYEALPYPPRDPQEERTRLRSPLVSELPLINHLFWAGHRPYDAAFRVLDAGCGTGDNVLFLAEQLRDAAAEVVALDFSAASLAVARERAGVRGLTNLRFVQADLTTLPALGLGAFDYIVSPGVLHHLASPTEGLAALRAVLKPTGGLGVMVYARYGRLAVYLLQDLFRRLLPAGMPPAHRIREARQLFDRLPAEHWAALGRAAMLIEVQENGDAGFYDLFLHARDRAFTVPEIYEWVEGVGLQLVRFTYPSVYDPRSYQPGLPIDHLSPRERHATAELLNSRMARHTFFATHADVALPLPPGADDESAVPAWTLWDHDGSLQRRIAEAKRNMVFQGEMLTTTIQMNGLTRALLRRVDGRAPLGAITAAVDAELPGVSHKQVWRCWHELSSVLRDANLLALNPAA